MERNLKNTVESGFALFSMFFGSGNLVFPLLVGVEASSHPWIASLGILVSGVALPFFGVWAISLYKGDLGKFLRFFGPKGTFYFSFVALALMGPFGVLARCLTVIHGGVQFFIPNSSLTIVSASTCLLISFLTFRRAILVNSLGKFLTPILLFCIGAILFFGFKGVGPEGSSLNTKGAFIEGFFQGYQTMDLIAALFFSIFILEHLDRLYFERQDVRNKVFLSASILAAFLLGSIYIAFVYLGSCYNSYVVDVEPQLVLSMIAKVILGDVGGKLVALTSILACLTTALVLTRLFTNFLQEHVWGCQKKWIALLLTLVIAFTVAYLEFSTIARILAPILEFTYPVIIAITLFNTGRFFIHRNRAKSLVQS
ncbi:MAG: hypothetical protein FJZ61_03365 [Chlamydiae bacterium]|nr:hypothetical protein [Chlamydiota bacterium]